jgi:D-sedoheptulose 7-phosphate isomerase
LTPKASIQFRRIGDLLAGTQVTDGSGVDIGIDAGSNVAVDFLTATGEGTVFVVGNGGSASIAAHAALDLFNRARIRAMAFYDPATLTMMCNDYGYIHAFERQINFWGKQGGALIAISSSGKSENILRAVKAAQANNCKVITISGFAPTNPLRSMGDVNFYTESVDYGEVESAHSVIAHFLTDRAMDKMNHPESKRD